jgi:hypothetical protein
MRDLLNWAGPLTRSGTRQRWFVPQKAVSRSSPVDSLGERSHVLGRGLFFWCGAKLRQIWMVLVVFFTPVSNRVNLWMQGNKGLLFIWGYHRRWLLFPAYSRRTPDAPTWAPSARKEKTSTWRQRRLPFG